MGSREPQRLDWSRLERVFAGTPAGDDLRETRVLGDAVALAATWKMGRPEMERWAADRGAFPSGTPLNTDDHPYLELVAPRRNVLVPADAARAAAAQYAAMGRSAGDVRHHLEGAPLRMYEFPAEGGPGRSVTLGPGADHQTPIHVIEADGGDHRTSRNRVGGRADEVESGYRSLPRDFGPMGAPMSANGH